MVELYCFDMDGVLVRPYTHPEQIYEQAELLLRSLTSQGKTVIVSSMNPRAYRVLKHLLDDGTIKALRACSIERWWEQGNGRFFLDQHGVVLHKGLHIHDMIEEELKELHPDGVKSLWFFDDTRQHLEDVSNHFLERLPHVDLRTFLIPSEEGVSKETLLSTPFSSSSSSSPSNNPSFSAPELDIEAQASHVLLDPTLSV